MNSLIVFFQRVAIILVLLVTYPVYAGEVEDWEDEDGICSLLEKVNLQEEFPGKGISFTKETSKIFRQGLLNSRPTNNEIPGLTKVQCHAEAFEKILITSDQRDGKYCGWVEKDNLIKSDQESFFSDESHCGVITPINITKFCSLLEAHGQFPGGCAITAISSSVIDTKFITDNTSKAIKEGKKPSESINVYRDATSNEVIETIDIFTVLQVFDVQASEGNSNDLRYLVGPRDGDIRGWISQYDGKIWYTKLAAYFSLKGNKGIYRYPIGTQEAVQELWSPHPGEAKIAKTVYGPNPFSSFPILFDHRKIGPKDGVHKRPHLEIQYIARTCGTESSPIRYCSSGSGGPPPPPQNIRTDILFLIDGTKSMRPYFGMVADVVKKFSNDKVGKSSFRIGVSMYGDYTKPSEECVECDMQYRSLRRLRTLKSILNLNEIRNSELYIKDPKKDKFEATGSAIFRASKSNWKENALRVIIHIGDHGDRYLPKEQVLSSLMENKVIYLPIAVRGEKYFPVESDAFINQADYIHKKHGLRDGGNFVSLASKAIVTYDPSINTNRNAIVEEEAVARAFVAGMELAETLTTKVVPGAPSVEDSNTPIVDIPIGIFCKNLFPDHPVCQTGGTDTTFVELVAVKGYIEAAKIGDSEKNWDYFVAMEKSRFLDLKTSFEKLCNSMQERNSPKIANLVLRVIESLTGDVVDRSDVKDYFKKKEAIPLVGETLLSGIRELDTAIKNDDRDELFEYAKDYCRSATLLSMMLSEKIVKNPIEDVNSGGDLIWDASKKKYSIKNQIDHNWYYKDIYNLGLYFVPLNYLPQKRS